MNATKTNSEVMVFQFSETHNTVRTLLDNGEIYFVGSDVAKALGYKEPHKAIRRHCRYGMKRAIPHPQNPDKELKMLTIPEGDVFRLIIHSELESAQKFESWVMDEVLPNLRKKGYYTMNSQQKGDFLDMRDAPYYRRYFNGAEIRIITIEGEVWYNLNDIHVAIGARTRSNQAAKKLNAKRQLAQKIWGYGQTNPGWFTNELGFQLIVSGSKVFTNHQLSLPL